MFSYVAGVALLAGIVAGLAPALRMCRTNLNDPLPEGGRGLIGPAGRERHWLRRIGDSTSRRFVDRARRRWPVQA